jgi:hypothetical protein
MEAEAAVPAKKLSGKRLSLNLADNVYDELVGLANERHSSMTEIIRLALGLIKVALQESKKGNKLVIASPTGEPLKELILPS